MVALGLVFLAEEGKWKGPKHPGQVLPQEVHAVLGVIAVTLRILFVKWVLVSYGNCTRSNSSLPPARHSPAPPRGEHQEPSHLQPNPPRRRLPRLAFRGCACTSHTSGNAGDGCALGAAATIYFATLFPELRGPKREWDGPTGLYIFLVVAFALAFLGLEIHLFYYEARPPATALPGDRWGRSRSTSRRRRRAPGRPP